MVSVTSIYIPRISTVWDEESIKNIMATYFIGIVSYVDFAPINPKPGFTENHNVLFRSAFVHFSDSQLTHRYSYAANYNYTWFWNIIYAEKAYKLKVSETEYWICLKNKKPIQRTIMNIHQVVENCRHLEHVVTTQADEIKTLKETIARLEKKVEEADRPIYSILSANSLSFQQNRERIETVADQLKILEDDLRTYGVL